MAEKMTRMIIKVDLQCYRCYKKVRKVIGKYLEIRDQAYDDKQNKVLITVVSCCPERIREKIICKGGKSVESIVILPEKKPEAPPPPPPPPGPPPPPPTPKAKPDKKKGGGGKGEEKTVTPGPRYIAPPVSGYSVIYPSGMYYQPPPPYYQGCGAVPYYDGVPAYYSEGSYGVNRGYNTNRCDYFSEEKAESCTVM